MSENAMTKTKTKVHQQTLSAASAAPEQTYASLFEGNRQALERWFRGMQELSQELLQFTQARLQEDATAWAQLAGMRNFEEALRVQQHFAERMTKEYLEEFNRLSHIVAGMANGSALPSQSEPQPDTAGKVAA